VNDGNHIRVRYDLNNPRRYTIEGSEASTQLQQLMETLYQKDSTLSAMSRQADSVGLVSDSLKTVTRLGIEKVLNDRRTTLVNFIKKSNSPAAIFFALGKFDPYYAEADLKKQVDASAAKFPEHSGLAIYKAKLTREVQPEYALMNQPAPEIRLPSPAGDTLSLSSFRGKYVLVDFWASWCKPCRRENPNVVAAYTRFRDKNFTILGVSLDADKAKWVEAIGQDGLAWAHVSDLQEWRSPVVPQYQIGGIPFNVLVDTAGKIIASNLRGAELHNTLSGVLK
jgi:peroxiredoxin